MSYFEHFDPVAYILVARTLAHFLWQGAAVAVLRWS